MGRPAAVGAILALGLAAALLGAVVLWGRDGTRRDEGGLGDGVVVVFAGADRDGADVAQLVEVVTADGTADISPDTTVSIPGTDYHHLRDAYAFGGGRLVAALTATNSAGPRPFLVVPEPTWRASVDRAGGIRVLLAENVDVFDGVRLTTLKAGEHTLDGAQVAALVKALPLMDADHAGSLRSALGRALFGGLRPFDPVPPNFVSDSSPKELRSWWKDAMFKAAVR